MFNSFLDGSKPAIETTAVCNATGLTPAPDGLAYPAGSVDEIPSLMRPVSEGGVLHHKGQVEVVSSLERDGKPIAYDIRFGVWVVFEGDSEYIRRCFMEYGVKTDPSSRYACMYKRWHLIGLEVGISVASVGLRRGARRPGRDREKEPLGRRRARRRGRLHRGREAHAGAGLARAGLPAARARTRLEAAAADRRGTTGAVERRRRRHEVDRRARPPRNGADVRRAARGRLVRPRSPQLGSRRALSPPGCRPP